MNEALTAAQIAGRMSEPMRSMLRRARREWPTQPRRCFGPANTRAALRERGLGHGDFAYLTPLGEAVRAILMEQDR